MKYRKKLQVGWCCCELAMVLDSKFPVFMWHQISCFYVLNHCNIYGKKIVHELSVVFVIASSLMAVNFNKSFFCFKLKLLEKVILILSFILHFPLFLPLRVPRCMKAGSTRVILLGMDAHLQLIYLLATKKKILWSLFSPMHGQCMIYMFTAYFIRMQHKLIL